MEGEDAAEPTRDELERIAFGRAETPHQFAAAQRALEILVARDAARAEVNASPAPAEALPQEDPPAQDDREAEVPRVRGSRRGGLVALLVVIGLFVGAGCGVLIAHAQANPGAGLSLDSTGSTPTPVQSVSASASAALRSLLAPQTKADTEYPLRETVTTLTIVPTSIHHILTVADGSSLWTARTASDICMMWSAPSPVPEGTTGDLECATPTGFSKGGLTLSDGQVTWTWDGTTFTTTTGGDQ